MPDDGRSWRLLDDCGPFSDHSGAFYVTSDALAGEDIRFGFRVAPHHCNLRPMCHGGMLATFLDIAMARGLRFIGDIAPPLPTISMTLDYLAPAPLGAWIDARVSAPRITGSIGFVTAMIHDGDTPVMRGSGTYRYYKVEPSPRA